jgi:hypothetical protein
MHAVDIVADDITLGGLPIADTAKHNSSTGVLTGGLLSTVSVTEFKVSAGTGHIVNDDPLGTGETTITTVSWADTTTVITPPAGRLLTYIMMNSAGAVVQELSKPTLDKRRDFIFIGVVLTLDGANVNGVNQEQDYSVAPLSQFRDLTYALGFLNVSGNVVNHNGAGLTIVKTAGEIFATGGNYNADPHSPNVVPIAALDTGAGGTFFYRLQDGTNFAGLTDLEPGKYDDGTSTPATVATNKFTIQHAYTFVSGNVIIQYGQFLYNSMTAAEAAMPTEAYVTEPSIAANGVFISHIILKGNAADLTDPTQAKFFTAGKFGGATGGTTTQSMQNVYENSTPNPEIATNATNGPVTFREGQGNDALEVINVQNGAGTGTFSVTGAGNVEAATYTEGGTSGELVKTFATDNTYAGVGAGAALTTGDRNTLYGTSTGNAITTSSDNTFFGWHTGILATGDCNGAVGVNALSSLTSGASNVAMGCDAGAAITTGSQNVCMGRASAVTSDKKDCTSLGYNTSCTQDHGIAIGSGAASSVANSCVIGNASSGCTLIYPGTTGCQLGQSANVFDLYVRTTAGATGTLWNDAGTLKIA